MSSGGHGLALLLDWHHGQTRYAAHVVYIYIVYILYIYCIYIIYIIYMLYMYIVVYNNDLCAIMVKFGFFRVCIELYCFFSSRQRLPVSASSVELTFQASTKCITLL